MNRLEVHNLKKNYPSFTLNGVSFEVPQGAIMGFIGRNGAGKSTTLKSILGLVHADGGTVLYDGRDVSKEEAYFKENIGVAFGGVDFYPKKKLSEITKVTAKFYSEWEEEKYRHYLSVFSLDENKRVDQLSSGMRVKYLIALALSHNAKLLILDEPTSGLDPVSRDELTELFRAIVKDGSRSILFSTHITSDLEKCADYITFIKDGSIMHSGTMESFLTAFASHGKTLEDIIVSVERRPLDEGTII